MASGDAYHDSLGRSMRPTHHTFDCITEDTAGPGTGSIFLGGVHVPESLSTLMQAPICARLVVNCTSNLQRPAWASDSTGAVRSGPPIPQWVRFAISDLVVHYLDDQTPANMQPVLALLKAIESFVANGDNVFLHCRAGSHSWHGGRCCGDVFFFA